MRAFFAALGACLGIAISAGAPAALANPPATPQQALTRALRKAMHQAGGQSGALVMDLTTGQELFAAAPDVPRLPASVEKLYTTSTALLRFGPDATLLTSILGRGVRGPLGTWYGTLYLRGGGDPTFGSASFDRFAYGGGATMQRLVTNLIRASHITALRGRIVGDESYFDPLRGTAPYGFRFSPDVEGSLSALAYNRGLIDSGAAYVNRPGAFAASQLAGALRAVRVKVPKRVRVSGGRTPADAQLLATVHSPRMATLIQWTNTPSDNFFAEMLLKGLGAKFGGRGSTAAGAAVVRAEMASEFGIDPTLNDGSGLSRTDATSPRDVVTLLTDLETNEDFVNSLAVAGETGTLEHEMRGTVAQGNCRGKTGTLRDVANLAGYCQALDGHTLAFAFLANYVSNPDRVHTIEAGMAVAVAKYDG